MFCTNCGKEINDSSHFCPYCGKEVSNKIVSISSDIQWNKRKIIGVGFGVLVAITVIVLFILRFSDEDVANGDPGIHTNPLEVEDIIVSNGSMENELAKEEETVEELEPELILKTSQTTIYEEDGSIRIIDYVYDDYGNVISESNQWNDTVFSYTYSYDYYDNGSVMAKRSYGQNGDLYTEITYTEYGDELSVTNFSSSGDEVTKWEYSYDEKGNVLQVTCYHTYNNSNTDELEMDSQTVNSYNQEGLIATSTTYLAYTGESITGHYEYDTNGNLILYYMINDETGEVQTKTEYDPVKNSETYYSIYNEMNTLSMTRYEEYNINGDILVAKNYDVAGNEIYSMLRMYDYISDDAGNIIEKATYQDGQLVSEEIFHYE